MAYNSGNLAQSGKQPSPSSRPIQGLVPMNPIPPMPNSPSLGSLGGLVKTHTITISPDGTQKHTVSHDTGQKTETKGIVGNQQQQQRPQQSQHQIQIRNGMHHIPFKSSDGSIKYINARGEIS